MKPSHTSWGGTSVYPALRREVDLFEFEASDTCSEFHVGATK